METEQELIKEGAPLEHVQKLCDVHSALFHGTTTAEKPAEYTLDNGKDITNVRESIRKSMPQGADMQATIAKTVGNAAPYNDKVEKSKQLVEVQGHPINTFVRENRELVRLIAEANALFDEVDDKIAGEKGADDELNKTSAKLMVEIRGIAIHYAKKGDLLYPHLSAKYDISGPSDVMWTVDDEIRDEMAALAK